MNPDDTIRDDEAIAFEAAFNSTAPEETDAQKVARQAAESVQTGTDGAQESEVKDPAKEAGSDDTAAKSESAATADPFASLPAEVRDLLGAIPILKQQVEETSQIARREAGRVAALQSQLDKMRAAATAPAHAEKVKGLRDQGLPEIADAFESVTTALAVQPGEDKTGTGSSGEDDDPELKALDAAIPGWDATLQSTDFRLWLSKQDAKTQKTVVTTSKAKDIADALAAFNVARAHKQPSRDLNAERQARMAAGAVPNGARRTAARAPSAEDEEEAAFQAGFNA